MQFNVASATSWIVGGIIASGITIWVNPLIAPLAAGSALVAVLAIAIALWIRRRG